MARMVPFPMLPTESSAERRLYEGFLDQLPDEYVVYHSIDWILGPGRPGSPPVEGEADFVVAHAVDGLLVMEVKGGRIDYDPSTRGWHQTGRQGRHRLGEDPFHQAKGEMRSLVDILERQDGWERWRPSFGYAVAFPDGRYEQEAHPGAPVDVVLDHRHLDGLAGRVREMMRYWRRSDRRFGSEGMEALERALGFRVEIRLPLKLRFDEDDRKIVELTEDQMYALSFVAKPRRAAVVGPAGSGKTLLAIQLARRLVAQGKATLLTCFNRRLAADLRRQVGEVHGLDVLHFHELCARVAGEAGLDIPEPPADDAEARRHFEEDLPSLLARAAAALGPCYDAMVVDEAQDFRDPWWPSLLALHRDPDEGDLFIFSDDNQNLYGGRAPEELVGMTVPLIANIRNTRAINSFVSVFHEGSPPAGRGPQGRDVEILGYRDDEELARLLEVVLANLESEGVPLEDIVILTPARAAKSSLRQRPSVGRYRLTDEPEPGAVLVSTVHGFKGLERPVVILAEIGARHEEDLGQYLYVGGSRARDHLIVLATERVAARLRRLVGQEGP